MKTDRDELTSFVKNRQESLSVELKDWLNPSIPSDIAKIVKECLALRNFNGGRLLLGFDDKTLKQSERNRPPSPRETFHIDTIQGIVSKYSSEAFSVSVEFVELNGIEHPIIMVPTGIRTPVAVKADLIDGKKKLLAVDDVYIRTLNSNNTPSSSKARWNDWPAILEICFDNREADIGRFIRRHIASSSIEGLRELLVIAGQLESDGASSELKSNRASVETRLDQILSSGAQRFSELVAERKLDLPPHGTYQAALVISGETIPYKANTEFMNLIASANPRLTGWPVWPDSRNASDENSHPFVFEGTWEALIAKLDGWHDHLDFYRYSPDGSFYMLRGLQDDISGSENRPAPLTHLEFAITIYRVTETLAVGRNFARALKYDLETTVLEYGLRWTKLRGRILSSWANPGRSLSYDRKAYQDEVTSFVSLPANAPDAAMPQYVMQAIDPLFEVFDGFQISTPVVEDMVSRLLERKTL